MLSLDKYPELMTKEQVSEALQGIIKPSMIPRLKGLRKTRIGNGRGKILYRKEDVIDYINSSAEREGVITDAGKQKARYRKMGIPSLLPWEELQKARMGYAG